MSGSTTFFKSLAVCSSSASVQGTNPQLRVQASLYTVLMSSISSVNSFFMLIGRTVTLRRFCTSSATRLIFSETATVFSM
jgi:hypothetical protein